MQQYAVGKEGAIASSILRMCSVTRVSQRWATDALAMPDRASEEMSHIAYALRRPRTEWQKRSAGPMMARVGACTISLIAIRYDKIELAQNQATFRTLTYLRCQR